MRKRESYTPVISGPTNWIYQNRNFLVHMHFHFLNYPKYFTCQCKHVINHKTGFICPSADSELHYIAVVVIQWYTLHLSVRVQSSWIAFVIIFTLQLYCGDLIETFIFIWHERNGSLKVSRNCDTMTWNKLRWCYESVYSCTKVWYWNMSPR